jgi:hypothetical protein
MRSIFKSAIYIIVIFTFVQNVLILLNYIPTLWYHFASDRPREYDWIEFAVFLSVFLLSFLFLLLLWLKASSLTRLLAGDINDNKLVLNTSNSELFKIVLILIGIYLVVVNIPEIFGVVGYHFRFGYLYEGMNLPPQEQANELKLWIIPIASVIIGLVLAFGVKKYWWKWNNVRTEKKNMIYPSRPFSITKITLEGFDPAKSYPVLGINLEPNFEKNSGWGEETIETSELTASREIAFFLVGDDNGEFAWIAEDECRLAAVKE